MTQDRPLVSAVLLSYNCAAYIEKALESVLVQDYEDMEIVVSDDASDDDTVAVLQRVLGGSTDDRPVRLRRRHINSGSKSAHLNDALRCVSGDIVVFFDGDDVSEPSRVRKIVEVFLRRTDVQAVYSAYALIDKTGHPLGRSRPVGRPDDVRAGSWFARVGNYASGGTLAVRRRVIDVFGSLPADIHEDVTLPFRASLLGDVVYLDEKLVRVRRHSGGLTQNYAAYACAASYRERFLWGIERAREQRSSRLADLRKAERLMPNRAEEFAVLREIVGASGDDAERSAGLVSASFWDRLATFLRLMRSEYYTDSILRDLGLVFVPGLYLGYKRYSLSARTSSTKSGDS